MTAVILEPVADPEPPFPTPVEDGTLGAADYDTPCRICGYKIRPEVTASGEDYWWHVPTSYVWDVTHGLLQPHPPLI